MNRNVLLVYLKDLRDLEFAKYKINSIYRQEQRNYKREVNKLQSEISELEKFQLWDVPEKEGVNGGFIFFLIFTIMCGIGLIISIMMPDKAKSVMCAIFLLCGSIFGFFTFACAPNKGYREEVEKVKEHNRKELRRVDQNAELISKNKERIAKKSKDIDEQSNYLRAEFEKAGNMLEEAYNLDIIPLPYRNLQSIYYIYNYMSTSQATLEETLFHEHMENGIQRILDKLDTIIAQNEEIIFHSRIIEANTREISERTAHVLTTNQQILESQERTEQNTLEAAQNARIAANYAEINAFFSTANYLESQRR